LLAPGTRVGEYVVGGLLGQGGFGAVYEAVHPVIGKRAAVKVLSRAFCNDRGLAARFVNEARAVNTIRHRNIVDVFSFGQLHDGRLFFIMEMLEGETLQAYLRRRTKLEVDEALHIFTAIAKALEATHAAGIIHRDLKPANVFLAVDLAGEITPKLLDFGVAKLGLRAGEPESAPALMAPRRGVEVTGEGAILGTPSYMAPEQSMGEPITAQADVYAFGVMMHRALTGKLPFERGHALGMAIAHATVAPPAMSEVSDVSSALDAPVLRMLEKHAQDRPASITAALEDLVAAARTPQPIARVRRRPRRRGTFKRKLQARRKPVPWWWWCMPVLLAACAWVVLH
jgi:serine/threonine-protein kinase